VLIESRDEWHVADRRFLYEESMAQLTRPVPATITETTNRPEAINSTSLHKA